MTHPIYTKALEGQPSFKVVRDCCTSSNCINCLHTPRDQRPLRVTLTSGWTKESAERIAYNWRGYRSEVVESAAEVAS